MSTGIDLTLESERSYQSHCPDH